MGENRIVFSRDLESLHSSMSSTGALMQLHFRYLIAIRTAGFDTARRVLVACLDPCRCARLPQGQKTPSKYKSQLLHAAFSCGARRLGQRETEARDGYKAWCKNSRLSFHQNGTEVTVPQPLHSGRGFLQSKALAPFK